MSHLLAPVPAMFDVHGTARQLLMSHWNRSLKDATIIGLLIQALQSYRIVFGVIMLAAAMSLLRTKPIIEVRSSSFR